MCGGEEARKRRGDERAAERNGPPRGVVRNDHVLARQGPQGFFVVLERPAGSEESARGERGDEGRGSDAAEAERGLGDDKGFFFLLFLSSSSSSSSSSTSSLLYFLRFEPHGEARSHDRDVVVPTTGLLEGLNEIQGAATATETGGGSPGFSVSSGGGGGGGDSDGAAVAAPPRESHPQQHLLRSQVDFSVSPEELGGRDTPHGGGGSPGPRAAVEARDVEDAAERDEDGVEVRGRRRRRDVAADDRRGAHGPPREPAQLEGERGGGARGEGGAAGGLQEVLERRAGADREVAVAGRRLSSPGDPEVELRQLGDARYVDPHGVPGPFLRALDPDLGAAADQGTGRAARGSARGAEAEQRAERRRSVPLHSSSAFVLVSFAAWGGGEVELGLGARQELPREEGGGVDDAARGRRQRRGGGGLFFTGEPRWRGKFPSLAVVPLLSLVEEGPEGVDDRPVAGAAAEVAAEHVLDVLCRLSERAGGGGSGGRGAAAFRLAAAAAALVPSAARPRPPRRVRCQAGVRSHHEPGGAEAALRAMGAGEGGGEWVKAFVPAAPPPVAAAAALEQPLDRDDGGALGAVQREEAGVDRPRPDLPGGVAVHERHGAGAAAALAADELGAREAEVV